MTERSAQRHAKQIGHGHPCHHNRNGFRPTSFVGKPRGHNRSYPKVSDMRQTRNETGCKQHPIRRRDGSAEVADHHQRHQSQQNVFERIATCPKENGGAKTNPEGVGRDEMPGRRYADIQIGGYIRQDAHHGKFSNAQPQSAESQCNKTFFHRLYVFLLQ